MKLNHRRTIAMLIAAARALVAGCGLAGAISVSGGRPPAGPPRQHHSPPLPRSSQSQPCRT